MTEQVRDGSSRAHVVQPERPRAWWLALACVAIVVVARSVVFVFWEQSYFDSNQAVIGLMAKHLVERRAFPLFMYGQPYMLAVEAWLAAPLFLLAGPSATALKLPLLAMNLAIAALLLVCLRREVRLTPAAAAVTTIFFVLPSPGTAATLLEASGGVLEPFLYVLLIWIARRRPVWCGVAVGIGFLHREFSIYGLASLVALEAAHRSLFTWQGLRRLAITLLVASAIWGVVQAAAPYSSAMGPGTTWADLAYSGSNVAEIEKRFCFDWRTIPGGVAKLATVHWPQLFGTRVQRLSEYGIDSRASQGLWGVGLLLGAAMLLAAVRVAATLISERRWRRTYDFCAYLVLVGALSVAVYVVARCGVMDLARLRYELLSILGAVGLAGWYLLVEPSPRIKTVWVALVLSWAVVNATSHIRLLAEYLRTPPTSAKELIARQLEARGIRYGISDYFISYQVAFLTGERVQMSSTNRVRISLYEREVAQHRHEAVRVSRVPCGTEPPVIPGVYFCPP
jgi:hypothetical protein